jgi:hypothetical protein
MIITSLLFIKARFYTHLPATSNLKTSPGKVPFLVICAGASALITWPENHCVGLRLSFENVTCYDHHKVPLPFPKGCGPFPFILEEYAKEGRNQDDP